MRDVVLYIIQNIIKLYILELKLVTDASLPVLRYFVHCNASIPAAYQFGNCIDQTVGMQQWPASQGNQNYKR